MTATATRRELKIARGFALPLDLVTEATAIVATRGAGKSSTSAVLVEESFAVGVQSVIFDRTGVYWGLRSNAKGDGSGLPIYVLGGPHGDLPLEAHAGVLIADLVVDSGHSFVLDLSDFSKSGAIKFSADFLERLYDRKARSRSTTLVVMDEAHFYAPQTPRGGFKGDAARLMGAMEDMVGLGRSRGLGVVLTTQRTQALNKAVLDLIETLLVMRMLSPRARDAVQDWIREKHEDDREGVIATLERLPDGTAWVWSPLRGILQKVAIRRIKTFNSFATPKPGETAVEPTVRKELDLAALGEEMAATAEKAKENDPAELRKRLHDAQQRALTAESTLERVQRDYSEASLVDAIRDAEERLRTAGWLPPDEQPEPERVEVPVATIDDLDGIWKLVQAAKDTGADLQGVVDALVAGLTDVATPLAQAILDATAAAEKAALPSSAPRTPPRMPEPDRSAAGIMADSQRHNQAAQSDGVPGPQQKILDALRWYEALRVTAPTRVQVAMIAGKSHRSGGFANLLGKLSTAGLIEYPSPGHISLTEQGRPLATNPGLPTTNEGVQRKVLARLPAPQAKLLTYLLAAWPKPVTRQQLGEATDYSPSSGGFANLLGKLSTGALIRYPQPGYVVADDVLFPMSR